MINSKVKNHLLNTLNFLIPDFIFRKKLEKTLNSLAEDEKEYVFDRVNYYNRLNEKFQIDDSFQTIKEFKGNQKKTRFFDLYKYLRYFNKNLKIATFLGDIIDKLNVPTLLKARHINDNNDKFVLMNLGRARHFIYVDDQLKFEDKKDMIVWRGAAYRPHRREMVQNFYDHPMCDIGQTNKPKEDVPWEKKRMTIEDQLKYKFILSIEGNDVATNLKWIMSSNSLAFMIKPKYDSWFMEERLIPGHHYVLIKDDYSDMEEKMKYYSQHTDESLAIIKNAQDYMEQFRDMKREDLISLLVLKKYFEYLK